MHGGIDYLERLLQQQKQADLTVGHVTAGELPLTASDVPAMTPPGVTPKRRYKARRRRCECCHEAFTPKRNKAARYCSDRCRKKGNRAKMAKVNEAKAATVERELAACTCLWCEMGWFADPTKHPKYCSASCRTHAYNQCRISAIETVAVSQGWTMLKAEKTVKHNGMKKTRRFLRQQGYSYDEQSRRWLIAVQPGELFAQEG